jgi:hypothetical protein
MNEMNKREQSEFNMAVSYLNRLNVLFYTADEAAISLNIYTWFHTLMALFRELSTEMSDDEIKQNEAKIIQLNTSVSNHISNNQPGEPVNCSLVFQLQSFEVNLRRLMKDAGLQQRMMDEAAKALR